MENQLEEGQIVLCTVDKIIGTTVFVKIEGDREGTITLSEIAPGRIRNLRDYVIPGKKIVCRILSIKDKAIQLSLRRVKLQERKNLLEKIEKERSYKAILKTVLGIENSEKIIRSVTEDYALLEFFEKLKKDKKLIEKYVTKEDSKKILRILDLKKEKQKEIKQIIKLSNKSPSGIVIVKDILADSCSKECSPSYLAAGKYLLSIKGDDFKELKNKINNILKKVESSAKKYHCEFSVEKG